jgi:hypothetical protein
MSSAAASPSTTGTWSTVYSWPDVAIHMSVLPDGRVLTYADDDNPMYTVNGTRLAGSTKTYVIDLPSMGVPGAISDLPQTRTNMFCSGHTFLGDGRLLVIGGHLGHDGWGEPRCELFDYRAYGWQAIDDMAEGRWYPSGCSLANGEVVAMSGSQDTLGTSASIPEIWSPVTQNWRQLTNANRVLAYYPFAILAPNGKVFVAGPDAGTYYLDCSGLGNWTLVANHKLASQRSYGSAIQYGDGKILVIGGVDPPTNTCETIDLTQATPAWSSTGSMAFARRQMNATILADGSVLATGGTSGSGFNNNTGAVLMAELWNGSTWTQMVSMATPRLYHSTAALLPDGRVLSAGGGRPKADNGGADHWDAEIYSPAYLFKGARPTISSAPTVVNNGVAFDIQTPDAASITQVNLVKLSSVTHAFNQSQRFNRLSFSVGSGQLTATVPASTSLAPPGHYMLFILNGTGIPSVAQIIQVVPPGPVAVEDDASTPLLDFMALRSGNPMTHGAARISFVLSQTGFGRVDLLDVTGRLVKTLDQGYYEAGRERVVIWDGTDATGARAPNGVYWYRLRTPTLTRTGKLALAR